MKHKSSIIRLCFCQVLFSLTLQAGCVSSHASLDDSQKMVQPTGFRGLYVPVPKSQNLKFIQRLVRQGKPAGINMLLLDVQSYRSMRPRINPEVVKYLKSQNIYAVSRVVCFQDGLKRLPVREKHMEKLYQLVQLSAEMGFDEVQLDYIRFVDAGVGYSLKKKYKFIEHLLLNIKDITGKHKVKLSTDVFGRIVYNRNDPIGQQLEIFAKYSDIIYPMLYPSHFTGDRKRMSNPEATMQEGIQKALTRLQGTNVQVQPFIQAFRYNIGYARVNLAKYIELQIRGTESTMARGWVAWNAKGEYTPVFRALKNIQLARM